VSIIRKNLAVQYKTRQDNGEKRMQVSSASISASCAKDGICATNRLCCAIDGSIVSASIGRSRNHRLITQRYLWICLSTFVLLL